MQKRPGFTLVEMLVAMALTVFIMAIVTAAFVTGLETFRQLKGVGDLQANLRTATDRLRGDLQADHFEARRRLSDPYFWQNGKPLEGFFRFEQPTAPQLPSVKNPFPPYAREGLDLDGLPSDRATDHILHFSIKLRGNRQGDFLFAQVGDPKSPLLNLPTTQFDHPNDARWQDPRSTAYSSQWGEVAYFLEKTGTTTYRDKALDESSTPLYSLYRVQRVVVADNTNLAGQIPPGAATNYGEMSCIPQTKDLFFPTPRDLAKGMRAFHANNPQTRWPGAALLLTDVVSFQVQVRQVGPNAPFDFVDLNPNGPGVYDTAANPSPAFGLGALKITLRVWDFNTRQTRQVTIIQDM